MKTKMIITFFLLGIISLTTIAQNNSIGYFGQVFPGDSAVIFAPGIISLPDPNEQSIVFSPDGKECFFGEWAANYAYARIYYSKLTDKDWTTPAETSFSKGHLTSNPYLSSNGNRLYFHYASYSAAEPYDIWMVQRTHQGWSEPMHLPSPINSVSRDGCYSETTDSIVYFASNRVGGLVQDGKIITSAGVSAGIDMALYLVSKIAGDRMAKAIQLGIEYDPQPPFNCGSPDKAPKDLIDKMR